MSGPTRYSKGLSFGGTPMRYPSALCPYCYEDLEIYTLDADQGEFNYFTVTLHQGKRTKALGVIYFSYEKKVPSEKWYWPFKKIEGKPVRVIFTTAMFTIVNHATAWW